LGSGRSWPALDVTFDAGATDLLAAFLDDFEPNALEDIDPRITETPAGAGGQPDLRAWRVFFTSAARRDAARTALTATFAERICVGSIDVADEGWAERSQADLRAVRVGDITVAPPWDAPSDASGLVVTILPSMGFGTGHHASTRLCLRIIQRLDLTGRSVLDVGTGSGVLAIVASIMGARPVCAVDVDRDATESAAENLQLNDVAEAVQLVTGDFRQVALSPADTVLANLTGGLLAAHAESLVRLVAPGGQLVVSGFSRSEEPAVRRAFDGWTVELREHEDEWVAVLLRAAPGS
jgi:ribosomal protein L11 methyltransferase